MLILLFSQSLVFFSSFHFFSTCYAFFMYVLYIGHVEFLYTFKDNTNMFNSSNLYDRFNLPGTWAEYEIHIEEPFKLSGHTRHRTQKKLLSLHNHRMRIVIIYHLAYDYNTKITFP